MTAKQEILMMQKQTEMIRQTNEDIKEIFKELGKLC